MTEPNAPKNQIRINVTQRDIERGVKHDLEFCPIARASKRALKGRCLVGVELITLEDAKVPYRRLRMPSEAARFVGRFDHGDLVAPFEFMAEDETNVV